MNQTVTEIEQPSAPKEAAAIDDALRILWDKVKEASDLIAQLRNERQQLHTRLIAVESELNRMRGDLTSKDLEIKRLKAELVHSTSTNNGTVAITTEEKEVLKNKIRELIASINSHL